MPPSLSPSSFFHPQLPRIINICPSTLLRPRTPPHRRLLPRTNVRPTSQGGPQRPQENGFENTQIPHNSSPTSSKFRHGVGAVTLAISGFYYYNREQVPISGRWRFNFISPAWEERLARREYRILMQSYGRYILPPSHPDSVVVTKVLHNLIRAAGIQGQDWEVKVIDDPNESNAFVLPGGKVFVFSGILPICATEDGLAAVLGHEIAHNVAHHTGESHSKGGILSLVGLSLVLGLGVPDQIARFLVKVAFELPNSREMESEADHLGLLMMAKACYDPNAALDLWERMASEQKYELVQILNTHPASEQRRTEIEELLPQAEQEMANSECGSTMRYVEEFRMAFGHGGDGFGQTHDGSEYEDDGFW